MGLSTWAAVTIVVAFTVAGFSGVPADGAALPADYPASAPGSPAYFEVNKGQFPQGEIRFRGQPTDAFLDETGFEFMASPDEADSTAPGHRVNFVGGHPSRPVGIGEPRGHGNYYGLDATAPADVRVAPFFSSVVYRDTWPHTDVVVRSDGAGRLEYDFVLRPGGEPERIRLEMPGATLTTDESGSLRVHGPWGTVEHLPPVAYQEVGLARVPVEVAYAIDAVGHVSFDLGRFDASLPLVIDPVVARFSTYWGSDASYKGEGVVGLAVDADGNSYVAGGIGPSGLVSTSGTLYPGYRTVAKLPPDGDVPIWTTELELGLYDLALAPNGDVVVVGYDLGSVSPPPTTGPPLGFYDAAVARIDGVTGQQIWLRYHGGAEREEAYRVDVHDDGTVHVAGLTESPDFPVTSGATHVPGGHILHSSFALKLDFNGQMIYSLVIGGGYGTGVGVDAAGNTYVASMGSAPNTLPSFPVTPGSPTTPACSALLPHQCRVVGALTKLDPLGNIVYSRYAHNQPNGFGVGVQDIDVDRAGNVVLVGAADASSGLVPTPNAHQPTPAGGADAMVAWIEPSGQSHAYATFFGAAGDQTANRVQLVPPQDSAGVLRMLPGVTDAPFRAVVGGIAYEIGVPVINTYTSLSPNYHGGSHDGWVGQFDLLSGRAEYAFNYGTVGNDSVVAVAADGLGGAWFGGRITDGPGLTTLAAYGTATPFQATKPGPDRDDGFVAAVECRVAGTKAITC